jgi:molecular chaperone DnaK
MNELNTVFQAASQEMYNAANSQGGGAQGPGNGPAGDAQGGSTQGQPKNDGEVTDVDFEEVK